MKLMSLTVLMLMSIYARADFFCALGSKSPINLNAEPYATMQVDIMGEKSIQLTIVPNYESIKYEVVIGNLISVTKNNNTTTRTYENLEKKKIILSETEGSDVATLDYLTAFTCDKLPLKD